MSSLAIVVAHQGAPEGRLFAESIGACRRLLDLYVIGVRGSAATLPLGIEDETITVRRWHSVASAWNAGILHAVHAGADAILVTNDDTVITAVALQRLLDHLDTGARCVCPCLPEIPVLYPQFRTLFPEGILSAYQLGMDARHCGTELQEVLALWYSPWGSFAAFCEGLAEANHRKSHRAYFHGAAFLGTTSLFEEVGLFDLRFKPAYHEDVDYSRRLVALGVPSVLAFDAYFHHWGSATARLQEGWPQVYHANEGRLREKAARGFYQLSPLGSGGEETGA